MKTKTATKLVRDASGRFASKGTSTAKSAKSNSNKVAKASTVVKSAPESSFIQNINLNGNGLFEVVMARNPRTTYFYKATSKGAKVVLNAIKSGKNLGHAFNTHLKSREVGRYIAVK